jgi:hypothetical protein
LSEYIVATQRPELLDLCGIQVGQMKNQVIDWVIIEPDGGWSGAFQSSELGSEL